MLDWAQREQFLLDEAADDLIASGDITPCLLGFTGEQARMMAFLRPFPKGEHADPLIEVLALAGGLHCDRVAVSLGGRAWSLEDPIAPVDPDLGDLRQRVVIIQEVDATDGGLRSTSTIHPYDLGGDEFGADQVHWRAKLSENGATGWVVDAVRAIVAQHDSFPKDPEQVRAQADRCARLGHLIALAPEAYEDLYDVGTAVR